MSRGCRPSQPITANLGPRATVSQPKHRPCRGAANDDEHARQPYQESIRDSVDKYGCLRVYEPLRKKGVELCGTLCVLGLVLVESESQVQCLNERQIAKPP